MVDIDSFPLLLKIAYVLAVTVHLGYVLCMVGATVQQIRGMKRSFKKWDAKVEAAAERMRAARTNEEMVEAMEAFTAALLERQEAEPMPMFEDLRRELWWVEVYLAFPALNVAWAITADQWWDWLLSATNIYLNYYWWKHHDHDDRWKKRRAKALAKVKEVGGKLVVVPVPAPTRV